MVGSLASGQADLVSTSLSVTLERSPAVDYGPPLGLETHALVVGRAWRAEEWAWAAFLQPLTPALWTALALNAVVVMAAVKVKNETWTHLMLLPCSFLSLFLIFTA